MNQPLEVQDFSGGMTDNYLAGKPNCARVFDNLLINKNKKPISVPGSVLRSTTHPQVPSGVKRIGYFWDHRSQQIEQTERHLYYIASGAYNELVGPTGNQALSIQTTTDHASKAYWNNHSLMVSDSFAKPIKIYKDGSNVLQVRTAGMPEIAAPSVISSGGAGNNYIYSFLYYYTYNVEGVVFEDFGATTQVQLSNVGAPDANVVHITAIPVLANGILDNYDTSNIKVKIYRTENDLTVLKFIGEVTNGTTIYNDSASDASITNNVTIYTNGDVLDNDTPPPSKYVHVANDIAMYGHVKENGVVIPNRIRQSIKGDIDSCPVDFVDDFPDEVMGISSIQSTFMIFGAGSVFRVDGFFDEQGRNGMVHLKISDTFGCVSNDSIVQVDDGIVFASQEGWCFTDGYSVKKIANHLNDTFKNFVLTAAQARNIWGAYDKVERRVWWAVQREASSTDNDSCVILDLQWGISEESSFTTRSNESSFAPTALIFTNGTMYRADKRGFVFTHDGAAVTDPKVDINVTPANWGRKTIIFDHTSCAFNFGTTFVRKFVPKILLTLANVTNISVQIFSINDDGRQNTPLVEIRYMLDVTWGDPDIIWGDPDVIWNKLGLIDDIRRFPAKNLRCNYKQIRITNSLTNITDSDVQGLATVDNLFKTVTLIGLNSAYPVDAVDYFISFENDDYFRQFQIITRNSDMLVTVQDALNQLPTNGNYKWEIKGYMKGQAIQIISYVVHYKMLTSSQTPFHSATDVGGNS